MVLVAVAFSLAFIVQGALRVPIEGSVILFLLCAALHLFATTSIGIFMATLARSMPQFGLLMLLTLLPLQMLSGGLTPRESMPAVRPERDAGRTDHPLRVRVPGDPLSRSGVADVVWPQFLALLVIGTVFFLIGLARFSKNYKIDDMNHHVKSAITGFIISIIALLFFM